MKKSALIGALAVLALSPAAWAGDDGDGGRLLHFLQGDAQSPAPEVAAPQPVPVVTMAEVPARADRGHIPRPADKNAAFHALIAKHANDNGVPVALGDAVVQIESRYNPRIVHAGNFGLMQIRAQTARGVGFGGTASALLDPATNLHFGMKYLAIAYHRAGGDTCRTLMLYQSGIAAQRPSAANHIYCSKARRIMAAR